MCLTELIKLVRDFKKKLLKESKRSNASSFAHTDPRSSSKEERLGLLVRDMLQAEYPSCHPTNSVNVLRECSHTVQWSVVIHKRVIHTSDVH